MSNQLPTVFFKRRKYYHLLIFFFALITSTIYSQRGYYDAVYKRYEANRHNYQMVPQLLQNPMLRPIFSPKLQISNV
jgi:hypothetical protein